MHVLEAAKALPLQSRLSQYQNLIVPKIGEFLTAKYEMAYIIRLDNISMNPKIFIRVCHSLILDFVYAHRAG